MTLSTLDGSRVSSVSRVLVSAVAVVRSPFTGQSRAQDWGGRFWQYDVQLGPWRGDGARPVRAFFARLEATSGRFLFADPTATYTGGINFPGAPVVQGASQAGRTLATDGWVPGVPVFAGMCFSLGVGEATRFHMVTADVIANASGVAALTISPPLRESPADNAPIEWVQPKVQLRVPTGVAAQIASGGYTSISFTAEEAL